MKDKKKTQNAFLEAINILINKKLKKLKFNYYVDGVIQERNNDNTYNILIDNVTYKNISSNHRYIYEVGDTVQVLVKNGNWNKKFISGFSHNNKFSTPIAKGYYSIDGTGEEFPLICHNGDNIWIGSYKRATRHHAGKGTYGKLFLSAGYNADLKRGNETIYVSVPNDDNTEATNYRVMHAHNLIDYVYPIGSIYMSVNNVSPASFLGGSWESWGSGRVPVGVNTSDTNFNTVEKTGGASTVTLTTDQIPSHTHGTGNNNLFTTNANAKTDAIARREVALDSNSNIFAMTTDSTATDYESNGGLETISATETTGATGGGKAHTNLQPYITCYMWKRTA